jgi:hypothetical protein
LQFNRLCQRQWLQFNRLCQRQWFLNQ